MTQKNKPIRVFRTGNICASIWCTEVQKNGRTMKRFSVRVQRRFKRQDGKYTDAKYWWPQDLPRIILVTQKAYEYIALQGKDAEEAA
jgi:hypothetical protein